MVRKLATAVALSLIAAVFVAPGTARASVPPPDQDPFYTAPADLGGYANGAVLRERSVTVNVVGIPFPVWSWQLLYKSTDAHGVATAAVTTVLVPLLPYLGVRPLLSYQTAEDSLGTRCAPSYSLRGGLDNIVGTAEMALIAAALANGWAVAVPDYEGSQSQYGAGYQAGHAVLDGIRAVTHFAPAGLGSSPVGMWGYSGGGLATSWAAELQAGYAAELHIVGVAQGGVPTDLEAAAHQMDGGPFSGLMLGAIVGISRAYPELDLPSMLNDQGRAMLSAVATLCDNELAAQYPLKHLSDYTKVPDPLALPQAQAVLHTDRLGQHVPIAPIYQYHSINDELIPIAGDDALAAHYCAAGVRFDYYRDPLSEHVSLAVTGAPAALAYLSARFAGRPAPTTC